MKKTLLDMIREKVGCTLGPDEYEIMYPGDDVEKAINRMSPYHLLKMISEVLSEESDG